MSGSRHKSTLSSTSAAGFANIEALIDGNGDITIGRIGNIRCAATAADGDQCLAMLIRRPRESLSAFLQRLDAAIADAYENDVFADEINAPQIHRSTDKPKSRR